LWHNAAFKPISVVALVVAVSLFIQQGIGAG
jgi:hypothetical protein